MAESGSLVFDDGDDQPLVKITADELLAMWNEACDRVAGLCKARALNQHRRRRIKTVLADNASRSYWQDVIERITRSRFCTGQVPGRRGDIWHADFDFLTRAETHLKVLEGKYDDTERGNTRRHGRARVYSDDVLPMRSHEGGH